MKKVRLALGAAGAAPAALGLMMAPAANAATVVRQAPQETAASSVSPNTLHHCPESVGTHARTANSAPLAGTLHYAGDCVTKVRAVLDLSQRGLEERVRFRSVNGGLTGTHWVKGCIFTVPIVQNGCSSIAGDTTFTSFPQVVAHQVCEAITLSGNRNRVVYGPVCENTS